MGMEDHAIVLDFLPHGRTEDTRPIYKKDPIAFALGEEFLTLIEVIPKVGVEFKSHERILLGKTDREKIQYIKRRVSYRDLSSAAKSELPYAVEELVDRQKSRFINFFNEAGAISTRLHILELLPGIGKKLMWEILKERKKKPFSSFEDITKRIKAISDPKKLIIKRIILELEEEDVKFGKGKYKFFVSSMPQRRGR
jgi:putative nucleotide binding protein|tara:strand:- start:662 stop:1252 length:591 start_codon:yes stop_codon:yes gene_type:complete